LFPYRLIATTKANTTTNITTAAKIRFCLSILSYSYLFYT
jgi:hypothetical protein